MEPILALDSDAFMFPAIFGSVAMVVITAIIVEGIQKTSKVRAREESRREIAAYVAEGSMTAEDAAKLLESNRSWGDVIKDELTT